MPEFYDLYVSTCDGQPCSMSLFQRAWACGRWGRKLKCRALGTHSACAECTRLREWARLSLSDEDKAKVADARERHRFKILMDRAVNTRLNKISARAMGHDELGPVTADLDVGGLTIDGMDQAKFKVPRWGAVGRSKDMEGLWRPQLHVHGVIIYGCRELFFLLDMTVPKDANMQVTVMARSLQLAYEMCNSRCRKHAAPCPVPLRHHAS